MTNDNDLDLLKLPAKQLKLAGKTFDYCEMTAGKALKAVELYQKASNILISQVNQNKSSNQIMSNITLMKKYQNAVIDVCTFIIQPEDFFERWKQKFFTRKWLYKNVTTKQLEVFIKKVLEPIIGDEALKKAEAVEKALNP
jgi:hypothetical protein